MDIIFYWVGVATVTLGTLGVLAAMSLWAIDNIRTLSRLAWMVVEYHQDKKTRKDDAA